MLCFIGILYDLSDSNSISVSVLSFPDFPVVRTVFFLRRCLVSAKSESGIYQTKKLQLAHCTRVHRCFNSLFVAQVEKYPSDISYIYPIIYLVIFALCSILPTSSFKLVSYR